MVAVLALAGGFAVAVTRAAESSGRASFDDAAELAVQQGLQARLLRNWQRSVQLKIRLTGTRAVQLPNVGVAAGSRTFLPQARFQLEEQSHAAAARSHKRCDHHPD